MANLSYHDPSTDPLPLHSPSHEAERARLEAATAEFLASGGQVDQVGFQMKEGPQAFVIDPKKTPVYAHLFAPPPVELKAKPARQLAAARITHDLKGAEPPSAEVVLAARVLVQASLRNTPLGTAVVLGLTEKQVRQITRDYCITFNRQR